MKEKNQKRSFEEFINMPLNEAAKEEWIEWAHQIIRLVMRFQGEDKNRRIEENSLKN